MVEAMAAGCSVIILRIVRVAPPKFWKMDVTELWFRFLPGKYGGCTVTNIEVTEPTKFVATTGQGIQCCARVVNNYMDLIQKFYPVNAWSPKRILLIGPMPDPPGGVSMHLYRLLRAAESHPGIFFVGTRSSKRKLFDSHGSSGNWIFIVWTFCAHHFTSHQQIAERV